MAGQSCAHVDTIVPGVAPSSTGCEDCLRLGTPWVHLRRCTTCGHVGCCDSSPMKHATAHFHLVGHPVFQSYEPGEDWLWCFVDEIAFELAWLTPSPSHT